MKNSFKKIISLVLTVLMLVGTVTMLVPITASAEEAGVENLVIGENGETYKTKSGITYRFDVADDHKDTSKAWVNPDGSWEFTISNGDMLWFPDIKLTSNSKIHAEVTNTGSGPITSFGGFAYGVMGTAEDGYTTASVASVNSNARLRPTSVSRSNLSNGQGNGGDVKPFKDAGSAYDSNGNYKAEQGDNNNPTATPKSKAWQAVVNMATGNISNDWLSGKTISFDLSKALNGKVTLEYGNPFYGPLTSSDNTSYTNEELPYADGSVGFTIIWNASEDATCTFRFDEIIVTNCEVGGVTMSSYRIGVGEMIEPHTEFEVDGKTYRFDPLDGNTYSRCLRMPDGTIRVRVKPGDLLWMPETQNAEGAKLTATMLNNEGQNNTDDLYSALAYNIDAGADGVWSADDDSAYLAVWKTNKERRICTITKKQIVDGATPTSIGELSNTVHSDTSFGERWRDGVTVSIELSKADSYKEKSGNFAIASFKDSTGKEIMDDYHAIDDGIYTLSGCIGFVIPWTRNASCYASFDILELTAVMPATAGVSDEAFNLSLDGTIGLNFKFNSSNFGGATVVAKKNGVEVVNQPVVNGENLVTVPVNAKEMKDTINISIMVDGEVFDEHSYTTSVAAYANQLMADDNYNKWDELITAMLNYGAAAQKLLDYKAEDAEISDVGGAEEILSSVSAVEFDNKIGDVLKGLYMNLSLESDTVLKLYFMPADEVVELNVKVNGEAAELTDNGDGYYVLSIEGIAADKLSEDFTIVVNGTSIFKVNALNWAKLASSDADENVATLAKALAIYSSCADEVLLKN